MSRCLKVNFSGTNEGLFVGSEHHDGKGGSDFSDAFKPIQAFVAIIDAGRKVHVENDDVYR